MMKVLRVGDPHITVRNLEEGEKLIDFVIDQARTHQVSVIEFMGDLMHTHAVVRTEVLDFWMRTFRRLSLENEFIVVALVGNHDQPGSREKEQQMNGLNSLADEDVFIINSPCILWNMAYIPYMSNEEEFKKAAAELYSKGAKKTLIAHQNFTVPLYHDMMDPGAVPQESIITGHIHEKREIGKVLQVGTPKWDTMSDANEDKGVWIFNHSYEGDVLSKEFISTKSIMTPIEKFTMNEGDPEITLNPTARNYLVLSGTSAWINEMKKKYKGLASIKAKPLDRKSLRPTKDKPFQLFEYLDSAFKPIDGVEKEEIKQYLQEVLHV